MPAGVRAADAEVNTLARMAVVSTLLRPAAFARPATQTSTRPEVALELNAAYTRTNFAVSDVTVP